MPHHFDIPQFLGVVALALAVAKFAGILAQRFGQPAVLGELIAGVILGSSVLGVVDPGSEVLHVLAELGVVLLLFEIGLETDLRKLLQVGGALGRRRIRGRPTAVCTRLRCLSDAQNISRGGCRRGGCSHSDERRHNGQSARRPGQVARTRKSNRPGGCSPG